MTSFGPVCFSGSGPGRWALVLAALLLGTATAGSVQAQAVRAGDVFYSKFGGGYAEYTGDLPGGTRRSRSVFDLRGVTGETGFPFLFTTEVGYHFSPQFALALGFQEGRFPFVDPQQSGGTGDTWRYTSQLLGRYVFTDSDQIVAPYVDGGINVTFGGDTPPTSMGIGPSVGAGLDILLSQALSFYVESRFSLTFPDDAIDGAGSSAKSFDMVNQLLGFGLKVRFTIPTPPRVVALNGPTNVQAGESVPFTATVNTEEADRPLTYRWQFGDGKTGTGQTVTHTYAQPGSYTATFTAKNEAGEASRSLLIRVERSPQSPAITSLRAKPNSVDEGQSVRFSSTIEGGQPHSYTWKFGDGATASGPNPTHTYEEPGTYTARLRVSNGAGEDVDTTVVRVRRTLAEVCTTISETNTVFFERGSSLLTETAQRSLQENVSVLLECPNLAVRVGAFAAPDEQIPMFLSQRRAQAVANFYRHYGIERSRIVARGRGQVEGAATREGMATRYRLADTTAVRTAAVDAPSAGGEEVSASASPEASRSRPSGAAARGQSNAGKWAIVVASIREKDGAQTIARRYRDRFGVGSVEIVPAEVNGTHRYRVAVGRFGDADAVKQALREHQATLPSGAWPLRLQRTDAGPLRGKTTADAALASEERSSTSSSPASVEQARFSTSGVASRDRSSAERWTIVVASMSQRDGAQTIAQRYRNRFESRSLSVEIVPAEVNGSIRHRVAVGRFETSGAVKEALNKYEARLPSGAWPLRLQRTDASPPRAETPEGGPLTSGDDPSPSSSVFFAGQLQFRASVDAALDQSNVTRPRQNPWGVCRRALSRSVTNVGRTEEYRESVVDPTSLALAPD